MPVMAHPHVEPMLRLLAEPGSRHSQVKAFLLMKDLNLGMMHKHPLIITPPLRRVF
jgi:hypothetical protein